MTTISLLPNQQDGQGQSPSPLLIERFLREREGVWQQIRYERTINQLILSMLLHSTVTLAMYGGVIGLSHSVFQAGVSAIKMPILFLLTMAICLPTLYLFNLFYGGQLSVRQALALILSAITITSGLTVAFVPIVLFFLFTVHSYSFFVLLNVLVLMLTGAIGMGFLVQGITYVNKQDQAQEHPAASCPPNEVNSKADNVAEETETKTDPAYLSNQADSPQRQVSSLNLVYMWLLLYGFVGTQLAWTLRPFFGTPGEPFMLFRALEGNFYSAVIKLFF